MRWWGGGAGFANSTRVSAVVFRTMDSVFLNFSVPQLGQSIMSRVVAEGGGGIELVGRGRGDTANK